LKVAIVVGTRPQIIKSAPLVYECLKSGLDLEIVHTGQHYDYNLSQVFLEKFRLPDPKVNLGVGSGSHAYQTGKIMLKLEKFLIDNKPDLVIVPGDTNSALAGALTSVKLGIPLAHLEAGARCYNIRMAEEINRRLIDHCSNILFAPTANCKENLEKEFVLGEIFLSGDTMYDIFLEFKNKAEDSDILNMLGLSDREYGLLTLHRAENVDDPNRLRDILMGIAETKIDIIFPIHPRTKNRINEYKISLHNANIRIIDPINYVEMLKLLKHAKIVLTDSGGLQKEAFWSGIPCVTLRERTEWIETVQLGVNFLAGTTKETISSTIEKVLKNYDKIKAKFNHIKNPYGNGDASKKIVRYLKFKFAK